MARKSMSNLGKRNGWNGVKTPCPKKWRPWTVFIGYRLPVPIFQRRRCLYSLSLVHAPFYPLISIDPLIVYVYTYQVLARIRNYLQLIGQRIDRVVLEEDPLPHKRDSMLFTVICYSIYLITCLTDYLFSYFTWVLLAIDLGHLKRETGTGDIFEQKIIFFFKKQEFQCLFSKNLGACWQILCTSSQRMHTQTWVW